MAEMTLREVCLALGVTRRAVQGYENANLVSATNKTESVYLLYNDSARERIKQIKLYQNMGFTIKEIQQKKNSFSTYSGRSFVEILSYYSTIMKHSIFSSENIIV